MSRILIHHAWIIPMTEETWIEQGYLVIDGQRITEVGKGDYPGEVHRFDRVIDASGKLAMPGLINTHGHAAMTLLRSYADDLPLMEWLQTRCWPIEDRMTAKDIYWGTQLAVLEMIKTGTTCFTDMYFHMDEVARVAEQSGIRAVLSRGMIGFEPKGAAAIQESRAFIRAWHGKGDGRITTMVGPHAPYTCPPEYLKTVVQLSEELEVPIQIHLSETAGEVEQCREQTGMTPIALMESLGVFTRPTLAAHCVHVTEEDMDIMAKHDVRVAHNPNSNLKLGSGIAPVSRMLQKGITVGLGTDGAASNNNLDMFEEMRYAALIHKGAGMDPLAVPAFKALEMATKDGARALFLEEKLGTLQPGALADLILLDYEKPYYHPRHNPLAHIVYAGQAGDVTDVIVNGQILMENRTVKTLDEERIYHEVKRVCERLFAK
jgi:5-methylthioadenosine/S-adenosylhomocysteine deaminase